MRVRNGGVCLAAVAACVPAALAWVATGPAAEPAQATQAAKPGRVTEISLRRADNAYRRIDFNNYNRNPPPFAKEASWGQGPVLRGFLPTNPPTGYARTASGPLYLDLNHNGDLTDDPDGVIQTVYDGHLSARGIRLASTVGGITVPYVVDLYTYPLGNQGWLIVRSGWEGVIDVGGQRWSLRVVNDLSGVIDERDELTLTKSPPGGVRTARGTSARVPKRLVLGDKCFDVRFEFQSAGDETVLNARLWEVPVPMGEVAIQGQFIRTLLLRAGDTLIVLEHPSAVVRVPAGEYRVERVVLNEPSGLRGTDHDLYADPRARLTAAGKGTFHVDKDQRASLKIGGPLRNTVTVHRTGNAFAARYRLLGAGGEEYLYGDFNNPAEINTYVGGVKIASGTFPFG